MTDYRIAWLANEAAASANEWSPYRHVEVVTDRARRQVQLRITVAGPVPATEDDLMTRSWLPLAALNELLRDLLAARADLVKLLSEQEN